MYLSRPAATTLTAILNALHTHVSYTAPIVSVMIGISAYSEDM